MNQSPSAESPASVDESARSVRGVFTDAIRYWEIRRLVYNLVLTGVVVAWVVRTWPHFRPALTWQSGLFLLILAVLANLCYCAAYPIDLIMQYSAYQSAWRRHRWILFAVGMILAALLASYWIGDEIYPAVG